MAKQKSVINWLKLRISFYPKPFYRKLIVAMCHVKSKPKNVMLDEICKFYFSKLSQSEIEHYINLYNTDPTGEIKKMEKENYINY